MIGSDSSSDSRETGKTEGQTSRYGVPGKREKRSNLEEAEVGSHVANSAVNGAVAGVQVEHRH